jgi:dipeptidyl-peptidase-4
VHLDEERRLVYFLGWQATPLERQLYRVGLDDGRVSRLSEYPGFHDAIFSADGAWYALTSDGLARPPSVSVRSTRAETRLSLHAAPRADDCAPGLRPPRTVEVQVSHGVTLHGAIYQPPRGRGPFPTVVSVYGGPHVQMVSDSWGQTVDLRAQYLASRGFLVFKLDNRGSARRGLAFEAGLDRRMGSVEVEDQVAGVNWLVGQGLADPGRVGVYGWSYGGYLTLMCLLKAPDVFRAGVAGAPVAAWDGYDSHYTERYMGTPSENPRGYRAGSAVAHASKLRGGLLLVHGMVDENVHFRHTARMVSALEAAGRSFELLVYPEERHMPRDANGRRYLEDRVARFFTEHLLG